MSTASFDQARERRALVVGEHRKRATRFMLSRVRFEPEHVESVARGHAGAAEGSGD